MRLTELLKTVTPPNVAVPLEAVTGLTAAANPPETGAEHVLSE